MFSTQYADIISKIDSIDPIAYGKSRNYINGAVTKLSPYISRGVISTQQVLHSVIQRGYSPKSIEPFIKELAWREYFQRVWQQLGDDINKDIKYEQPDFSHRSISKNIIEANSGLEAIDIAISKLYETGYMHNHERMYVASITGNIAKAHWLLPAQWMYYHLLDADWASNACSWQWVVGSFSSKKYYANQENINNYSGTKQQRSYLNLDYSLIPSMPIPAELKELSTIELKTNLPSSPALVVDDSLPTYIYNMYNLDTQWDNHVNANRILLLEPSFFSTYPVSEKVISFILSLSSNIPNIQIFVGEFEEFSKNYLDQIIHYKEHPLSKHYTGIQHQRKWIFPEVKGYHPSFFNYWKKCEKYLKDLYEERKFTN